MHSHQTRVRLWVVTGIVLLLLCNCGSNKHGLSKHNLRGFPEDRFQIPDTSSQDRFLRTVAFDTWRYFENAVDNKTGFVVDKIWLEPIEIADYTSITNIGLQMIAIVSAMDFGFISPSDAKKSIEQILYELNCLPRYNGFFYNWYDLNTLQESRRYISSVDYAWLLGSLEIVGVVFPDLSDICNNLINQANFSWLYDDSLHHFFLGYDADKQKFSPYHYGLLCSESRICLYLGIMQGNIQPENWYYQERTLPLDYEQQQKPQGSWNIASGIHYFQSYYEYLDMKIVPSWGGALFEFLMPGLFVNEQTLAPLGIGENNRRAIQVHTDYALNRLNYPVWGMSPSSIPTGGYGEFGVPDIGTKVGGYLPTVVSPHASILALSYNPQIVFKNLKKMLAKYPIYGDYGFYDSLDPIAGNVGKSYLALDQAIILISLNNYLNNGKITNRFKQLPGFEKIRLLLAEDEMF